MQKYKSKFTDDKFTGTFSNIQSCIRLNDISEINDGNHLLLFDMIGLFSFREMSLKQTVNFFYNWLLTIGIEIDYFTIHSDKIHWKVLLDKPFIIDDECIWSDGNIGGYCLEFYKDNLEIGNIVNTLGTCIDVGFGLERLCMILDSDYHKSEVEILKETILRIIECGIYPSGKKQGSILRKLIRKIYNLQVQSFHDIIDKEYQRIENNNSRYLKLLSKHKDKSKEWWFDTHGIEKEN